MEVTVTHNIQCCVFLIKKKILFYQGGQTESVYGILEVVSNFWGVSELLISIRIDGLGGIFVYYLITVCICTIFSFFDLVDN